MDQPSPPAVSTVATTPASGSANGHRPVADREVWYRRGWREYVTDVRADADAHAATTRATDRKMVIVFVTAAVALTCSNFLSDGSQPQWLERILRTVGLRGLATRLHDAMFFSGHTNFNRLAFWAVVVICAYTLPAVVVVRVVFRERLRDYGVRAQGMLAHARVYA
ncbi:MAG TPA: hypothetical protein VGT98_12120, partial [Candidatus Elarobacter sp.]|nr:hypothetical protein [Candidatus Elarobacter sp.]